MSKESNKIKKNIIAIDVGSSSIKVIVGDFNKEKLIIKKTLYAPIPEGAFVNGELVDVIKISQILRQTLKKNKLKAKNCFCVFQSNQIISREVTIPSPDKTTIGEMAKFEVEQFLPVEMKNYTVQSIVLKDIEIDDKPFSEMLVTAFPVKFIDQLHKMILLVGLKPIVLDTHANALSKLVENQYKINGNDYHRDRTVAFIDFGKESVSVNIFQKSKFRLNRILKVGGKDLDVNIAKFLDITTEEAEQKKIQINNINYIVDEFNDSSKVINVTKSTMSNWFDEIIKIFRYYSAKSPDNKGIEYIYIYGGGSKINGLTDHLESFFKVPVELLRKFDGITYYNNSADMDIVVMLNAIGVMYRM